MTEHRQFKEIANCAYEACKKEFYPRVADINRGWGKFCSKRCKANYQAQKNRPSRKRPGPVTIIKPQEVQHERNRSKPADEAV